MINQINNNLPKEWRKVKLGEVAGVLGGFAFKSSWFNKQRIGYPVIKIQNLGQDGFIDTQNIEYVDIDLVNKNISKFKVGYNDFFVAMTGATAGKIAVLKDKNKDYYLNQRVGKFYIKDKNKLDFKYFYYSIFMPKNKIVLRQLADGSAQGNMSTGQIEELLEINLPPLDEQKWIADILSAFDDKIELNNKIIKTLEEMAQEVFKEKFNNSEKLIVNSEKLKLKKWEIKDAEDIFIFEKGIEPGSKYYSETKKEGYIPFYRVRDLDKQSGVDVYIPKKIANGKICKESDILISLDATVGRVKIGCNGAFSSGIRKVYSKDGLIKNSFIYFWLKTPYVQDTILEHASGTTILHAGQAIKYLKIPFNKEIIKEIQSKVDPMFEKILQILKETQTLAVLRDLLLLKLMSGEIKV